MHNVSCKKLLLTVKSFYKWSFFLIQIISQNMHHQEILNNHTGMQISIYNSKILG
jgi:hypothetical protein